MSWDRFRIFWSRNGLFLVLALALVAGLAAAVWRQDLDLDVAVLAGFFGLLTAFFAGRFVMVIERDPDRPGFESHWGGLGGGLGGWRISTSLVYLMAAIAFGGLLALTAGLALSERTEEKDSQEETADANEPAAEAGASDTAEEGEGDQEGAPAATDANEPAPAAPAGGGNPGPAGGGTG